MTNLYLYFNKGDRREGIGVVDNRHIDEIHGIQAWARAQAQQLY